jgi:hypothetical protein
MSIAVQSNRVPSPAAPLPAAKSQAPAQGRPRVEALLTRPTDQGRAALEKQADRAEFDRLQTAYDEAVKNLAEPGGEQRLNEATGRLMIKSLNAYKRSADDTAIPPNTVKQITDLIGKPSAETASQVARWFV